MVFSLGERIRDCQLGPMSIFYPKQNAFLIVDILIKSSYCFFSSSDQRMNKCRTNIRHIRVRTLPKGASCLMTYNFPSATTRGTRVCAPPFGSVSQIWTTCYFGSWQKINIGPYRQCLIQPVR